MGWGIFLIALLALRVIGISVSRPPKTGAEGIGRLVALALHFLGIFAVLKLMGVV